MTIDFVTSVAILTLLFISMNWMCIMYLLFARSFLDKQGFHSFSLFALIVFPSFVLGLLFYVREVADYLRLPYMMVLLSFAPLPLAALQLVGLFLPKFSYFLRLPFFFATLVCLLLVNVQAVLMMMALYANVQGLVIAMLVSIPIIAGLIWFFIKVALWARGKYSVDPQMIRMLPLGLLVYVLLLLGKQWLN